MIISKLSANSIKPDPNQKAEIVLSEKSNLENKPKLNIDLEEVSFKSKKLGLVFGELNSATSCIKNLESELKKSTTGFWYKQGIILLQVVGHKLYKEKYTSFAEYVKEEFKFTASHCYLLMRIANKFTWEDVKQFGENFTVARELSASYITEEIRPKLIEHVKNLTAKGMSAKVLTEKIKSIGKMDASKKEHEIKKAEAKRVETVVIKKKQSQLLSRVEEKPRKVKLETEKGDVVSTLAELAAIGTAGFSFLIDSEVALQAVIKVKDGKIDTYVEFVTKN